MVIYAALIGQELVRTFVLFHTILKVWGHGQLNEASAAGKQR